MKKSILMVAAMLVLVQLACSVGGGKTSSPDILYEDDFSDPKSGWDSVTDVDGTNDYYDGGYRILVNKANWFFWSNPGKKFTDLVIDVDATKIGGPDDNDFGVVCRYQDNENFYYFAVSSDGYFGISKFIDGTEALIGMESLMFDDTLVNLGNATNHISASCVGSKLSLSINGTSAVEVADSDLSSGDIGLIAGSYSEEGVDILFDNLVVRKP